MSASDTLVKDNPPRDQYTASSAETTFPFNFLIFDSKDLVVLETTDPGTSQETTTELVEGTDYSVSGVGNEDGGSITLTSGANDGDIYTLYRDSVIERLTDFLQTGDFTAENINKSLDVLTTILQEFEVEFKRAATLPESSIIDDLDLPKPEADHYIRWNTNADDLENVPPDNVSGLTEEEAQDTVASSLSGGDKVTVTYDDANGVITIDTSALDTEETQDAVNSLISAGSNITTTYDDANGVLTISASDSDTQLTNEEVQDIVGGMVSGNTETLITVTYDDTNNVLNFSVDESNISHDDIANVSSADHHTAHTHPGDQNTTGDITDDNSNTIYDYSNTYIPDSIIQTAPSDGSAGQVPVTDGTSFSFGRRSEIGWQEDSNSPQSGSGVVSFTYTVADSYDLYHALLRFTGASKNGSNSAVVDLRINGKTTTDYLYMSQDGSGTTGASKLLLTEIFADTNNGEKLLSDNFLDFSASKDSIRTHQEINMWSGARLSATNIYEEGAYRPKSSGNNFTFDSFKVFAPSNTITFDYELTVYGVNTV